MEAAVSHVLMLGEHSCNQDVESMGMDELFMFEEESDSPTNTLSDGRSMTKLLSWLKHYHQHESNLKTSVPDDAWML